MRIAYAWVLACVLLTGCTLTSNEQIDTAGRGARACIDREAPVVALTKLDLEAAAMATLGRCAAELDAERRLYGDRNPGSGNDMDRWFKELAAVRFDQARTSIAMERLARR